MINVIFISADGHRTQAAGKNGCSLLEVAQGAGMPLEGTCEGQMACSTCHVIVERDWFTRLPPASSDEEDLLDLAAAVTGTSRLACQILLGDEIDGLVVRVPDMSSDMQVR